MPCVKTIRRQDGTVNRLFKQWEEFYGITEKGRDACIGGGKEKMGEIALVETDILYALMDVNDAHHKTAIISMDKVYDWISGIERTDPRSIQDTY